MKKILTSIIVIAICLLIGYVAGRVHRPKGKITLSDTTTVTVYDTVKVKVPEPAASRSTDIEVYPIAQVPVLLFHSDTVTKPYFVNNDLVIPISQRYYKDSRYEAWISGYNPRLDSIVVYNTHTLSTIKENRANNAIYVDARLNYYTLPAMGLELQAGYTHNRTTYYIGAGAITGDALRFYGMAGIRYTLFMKKW